MSQVIGVVMDSFDPVRSGLLSFCSTFLSTGEADRILLIPFGDDKRCSASLSDRWRMLAAACNRSRFLLPLRLPDKIDSSDPGAALRFLKKKNPKDRIVLLSHPSAADNSAGICFNGGEPEDLCPSVLEYCSLKGLYGAVPRLYHAGEWTDMLFDSLNPHRFAHTLSVARTALSLAVRYGIDPVKAEEAGLLHDCAKCLPLSEMQNIAVTHRLTDDPSILESGSLLHSIAGKWIARERYGMEDPDVLEAIEYHNTGHAGMSPLAMCVCLADFIEPNREVFPLLEKVRRLSEISLERALLLSLEAVQEHVLSKGKTLHPRTTDTIAWLKTLPAVQSVPDSPES